MNIDMQHETYVTYEQAQALKRLGFDWNCDHLWHKEFADSDKMALMQASADDFNHDDWYVPHYSAPRLDQAQTWLREKGIDIELTVYHCDHREYRPIIYSITGESIVKSQYPTYESALSAGITEALKILDDNNERIK